VAKRDVAAVLWFVAGWSGGGLAAGLLDLPSIVGVVPGIVLAIIVRWDPTHVLWSDANARNRTVRPINDLAGELDRDAAQGSRADGDRARA
jgi:hypothetical protein